MGKYEERRVEFMFSYPAPIGGVAQPIKVAQEFSDQDMNRYHNLAASATAGNFTLTFYTRSSMDERSKKLRVDSTVVSVGAGVPGNWSAVIPMQDIYWTPAPTNEEGFVYLITIPFTVQNGAVISDLPAGGANITIVILMGVI